MNPLSKMRIQRFSPVQRLFHAFLLITFLIQSATGLGRMYMETGWGKGLNQLFGGYESAKTIHIYIGVLMLCGFFLHILYLLATMDWKRLPATLWGPDSLIPGPADIRQFFQHVGWFLGIRKSHPEFDRWGYWEKFDYWAVFWGMIILGGTGLLLTYSLAASRIMPGWGLNVAFWVHRIEAMLAMAHVFIIHFFIAHLRRHNFPMDRAMFEGSADMEGVRHERPAWIGRLEKERRLDAVHVPEAPVAARWLYYIFGYTALLAGVLLLIGAIINMPYITW